MRITTGIEGLDHLLHGGLLPGRVYLINGGPGTGKTTLGLHFLAAGKNGLLVTFVQSAEQIRSDASGLNLQLDDVKILDLAPPPEMFSELQTYDIFLPTEVEREPISQQISKAITDLRPDRIFVDSFDHFRTLTTDQLHQRRFTQSFFRFATRGGATLLIGSEDPYSACVVDGVIQLDVRDERRTIQVTKFRGSDFLAGVHAMRITGSGLQVPSPPEEGGPRAA
jgi:circadian clock protein KaiC